MEQLVGGAGESLDDRNTHSRTGDRRRKHLVSGLHGRPLPRRERRCSGVFFGKVGVCLPADG
jgi:hypothetical protein